MLGFSRNEVELSDMIWLVPDPAKTRNRSIGTSPTYYTREALLTRCMVSKFSFWADRQFEIKLNGSEIIGKTQNTFEIQPSAVWLNSLQLGHPILPSDVAIVSRLSQSRDISQNQYPMISRLSTLDIANISKAVLIAPNVNSVQSHNENL